MKPWNPQNKSIHPVSSNPSTIGMINKLPEEQKRKIYARVIPLELIKKFNIKPELIDDKGNDLFILNSPAGSTNAEISLYHQYGFPDPVLNGQITDTINGQIHIIFYALNDPYSDRFDIDRTSDGKLTHLGVRFRNIDEEIMAMKAGLSPGQIRQGPHLLGAALKTFEAFIENLEHDLHFAEPLFYHNAIIFERYGFGYQKGRRLMRRIQEGFSPGGDLFPLLDGSTPFRQPHAANSIRLRSWAIHDGVLGEQFQNVTMYKQIGSHAGFNTCSECDW